MLLQTLHRLREAPATHVTKTSDVHDAETIGLMAVHPFWDWLRSQLMHRRRPPMGLWVQVNLQFWR